jgi:YbgC/YbaW family acyl-CoA thioester hydrolase
LDKKYTYKFVVRGYELDSYGHVNSAVYLNYLEQARWDIIEQLGLLKYFKETGNFLVVTKNKIKYIHELNIFNKVYIETSMGRLGFFVEFKQNIFLQDTNKKIAKSVAKCLFVDKYRNPLDIPDHIIPNLSDVPDSKFN